MGIIYKNGTYYGGGSGGGGGATYTAGDGINIANDEISIDSMSSSDMSEVVYPLPTVGTKLPILFDETGEERVVGWYRLANGTKKPVYEKNLKTTFASTYNQWMNVPHNTSNMDIIIDYYGTILNDMNAYIPINCSINTSSVVVTLIDGTNISMYVNGYNRVLGRDTYITILYTKTTDTPI